MDQPLDPKREKGGTGFTRIPEVIAVKMDGPGTRSACSFEPKYLRTHMKSSPSVRYYKSRPKRPKGDKS